jgi:hypothetical protein
MIKLMTADIAVVFFSNLIELVTCPERRSMKSY